MSDWKDQFRKYSDEHFPGELERIAENRAQVELAEQVRAEEAGWLSQLPLSGYERESYTNKRGKECERIVENAHKFINPYTFVPANRDKGVSRKKETTRDTCSAADLFTGYFDCELKIRNGSALFIPNTTKVFMEGEHKCYDFYSYTDLNKGDVDFSQLPDIEPRIPGSELRGMVRNVYEQITNSCFAVIDKKNYPHKRTTDSKKPYLLAYDIAAGWQVFDVSNNWATNKVLKLGLPHHASTYTLNGAAVHLTVADNYRDFNLSVSTVNAHWFGRYIDAITSPAAGTSGTYLLHISKDFLYHGHRKNHFYLIDPDTTGLAALTWPNREDALKRFRRVIKDYCAADHDYDRYKQRYDDHEPLLVFADDTLGYLSPASITKECYSHKIADILKAQGGREPCSERDSEWLCPACQLFGTIGKRSLASRVRFSDSYKVDDFEYKIMTLPILSNPRISATEFYLEKPGEMSDAEGTWNYDYYKMTKKGREPYEPTLAGRKVYWHGPLFSEGQAKSSMNSTVRALTKGTFRFKIFFEDISESELIDLRIAIRLPDGHYHKLGHGKPVGMGSVEVSVKDLHVRSYGKVDTDGKLVRWNPARAKTIGEPSYAKMKQVEKTLRYAKPLPDNLRALVDYPRNKPEGEIYEWFVDNRGGINNESIKQSLKIIDPCYLDNPDS